MSRTVFQLNVTQIESVCHFELRVEGQIITINLNYPLSLTSSYRHWQKAYLDYYKYLRGRKAISGGSSSPIDRNKQLVNAEAQLLNEFHRWLFSADLLSIRREIANAASKHSESEHHWVEVFVSCSPLELARLPWETWEIGTDLGIPKRIRIARIPTTILNDPVQTLGRKARILAVLGDDTGLNFEGDKQAVRSLDHFANVKFVGWNRKNPQDAQALKSEIFQAINDERGWDMLFFAGHSNETVLTGGELGIAPNVSLSIWEIEEALKQAKKRGLQFAIFNSCSGINIAESLINLGLSQVVVMREPIHNQVAQEFLMQFLKSLSQYKDVHQALLDASHYLKQQESRFFYPSAYLVPSLFRHPNAELFRIKPFGLWSTLKRWLPTLKEAKWLGGLLFMSFLLQLVPNLLLEPRILLQAIYRKITFQVQNKIETPLLLVQIDNKSLIADRDKIKHQIPLDYSYLARLIQHLSQSNAELIGIDYILDKYNPLSSRFEEQPGNTKLLHQAILDGHTKGLQFVFAYNENENPKIGKVSNDIISLSDKIEGDIRFYPWNVALPSNTFDCFDSSNCPFSYKLALVYLQQNHKKALAILSKFNLDNQKYFSSKTINIRNEQLSFLQRSRLYPISSFLGWFHPIIDFSIPPNQAYKSISACELMGSCKGKKKLPDSLKNKIVLIIPGGYEGAGIQGRNDDNFTIPLAVAFWHGKSGWNNLFESKGTFTGGEAHAYMIHHLLTRRLVVPIPDFLMILLFSLLGKGITFVLLDNPHKRKWWMINLGIATAVYMVVSLQVYISIAVLLPWLLPSVVLWNYVRLVLRSKSYE